MRKCAYQMERGTQSQCSVHNIQTAETYNRYIRSNKLNKKAMFTNPRGINPQDMYILTTVNTLPIFYPLRCIDLP